MDNYLSYRWPKGPGTQPPPVPVSEPRPAPPPKARRSPRRWIVPAVCVVLSLSLLVGVSAWAAIGLANLLRSAEFPGSPDDSTPHRTWSIPGSGDSSDWTLDDLPWGRPDPSVQLSTAPVTGAALSGRDIHAKVLPSLVYIRATEKSSRGTVYYSGTGIVVTASGYVLTNFHIIEKTDQVQVRLLDPQSDYYDAKVIGVDEDFDLAVLKFNGEGLDLTPAQLGDSDQLAVGDTVYAEGNPMGYLLGSMSSGIVSALGRDTEVNSDLGLIQIDVPLNPGNSGGALVNDRGQVVGITSAKITGLVLDDGKSYEDAALIENIGLAIPISDALPFINRILATGKSWRPSIGIQCVEAEVAGRRGIQVKSVNAGAPAQGAGLRVNDLIVSANGQQVTDLMGLRRVIYRTGVDGMLHCVVVRGGKELSISFTLIDMLGQQ